jgi:hypothetical protein
MAAKTVHAYTGAAYVAAIPRKASASAIKRIFSSVTTNIWEGYPNAVTSVSGSNTATGTFPNKTSNVTVSWSNPADTSLTASYDIFFDVGSSGAFTKHNSTAISKSSTSYTFGAIPAATNYRWFIRTIGTSGLTTDSATSSVFSLSAPASRSLTANTAVLTNGISWTATAGVYQRFYVYYSSNNSTWTGPIEVASSISQTSYAYQITTVENTNRYWRMSGQNTNAHWSPESIATVYTPVNCTNYGTAGADHGWTAGTPVANTPTGTCGNRVYTNTTTWTKTLAGTICSSYTTTSGEIAAPSCVDSCYDTGTATTETIGCQCSGSFTRTTTPYTAKSGSNCGAKASTVSDSACAGNCTNSDADCYTATVTACESGIKDGVSAACGAGITSYVPVETAVPKCGDTANTGSCGNFNTEAPLPAGWINASSLYAGTFQTPGYGIDGCGCDAFHAYRRYQCSTDAAIIKTVDYGCMQWTLSCGGGGSGGTI